MSQFLITIYISGVLAVTQLLGFATIEQLILKRFTMLPSYLSVLFSLIR